MFYQFLINIPIAYLLLGSYMGAPALLGIAAHHRQLVKSMATSLRKRMRGLRQWVEFRTRKMSIEDYLTYAIAVWIVCFFTAAAVQYKTHAVKAYAIWIIVAFLAISFAVLASIRFKLITMYKKASWLINFALLLFGLYVTNESSAISDITIAEFTHVNASNFPSAQRVLTTISSAAYWAFYSIVAGLAVCCLLTVALVFSALTEASQKKTKYIPGVTNRKLGKPIDPRMSRVLFSLLISLLYVVLTVTTYSSTLTSQKINATVKEILVKYSFHVAPEVCGLSAPDGSTVSLLSDKQAVLAIPDQKETYRFVVFECQRTLEKYPEIQRDITGSFKISQP
jgi:hypothetical protein